MYSQFGEDDIISAYFPDNYKGICIEIGAADGRMGSNTLMFEEKGWTAICVEPNPDLFKECIKIRKHHANFAISNREDILDFTIFDIPGSSQSAVSSLVVDKRLEKQHEKLITNKKTIKVQVITLDKLLSYYPEITHIDFISIDTEGTELDVLKGFDIAKWTPKMMIIENNFNDPDIEDYLKQFGYIKTRRHVVNDFYEYKD